METRKQSLLRALGVSMLAALALTAIAAPNAQGSGTGLILLNGASITSFPRAVFAHYESLGIALVLGLTFECQLAKITGQITSSNQGKGTVVSTGCVVVDSEETCLIDNEEIESNAIVAESLLLGKIARARPLTGPVFANVKIISHNEECSLIIGSEETLEVTGSACGEIVGDTIDLVGSLGGFSAHCGPLALGANPVETHGPSALLETSSGEIGTTHP